MCYANVAHLNLSCCTMSRLRSVWIGAAFHGDSAAGLLHVIQHPLQSFFIVQLSIYNASTSYVSVSFFNSQAMCLSSFCCEANCFLVYVLVLWYTLNVYIYTHTLPTCFCINALQLPGCFIGDHINASSYSHQNTMRLCHIDNILIMTPKECKRMKA